MCKISYQKMLFIIIYLISAGAEGVSVPQPVVLPPPLSHLRLVSSDQRVPAIFATSNSLNRPISTNLAHLRPHSRRPSPTRLLFEENQHQADQDSPEYPLHLQRHPDLIYRRPSPPRPANDYYVSKQHVNSQEFVNSEESSSNGFPANLKNPKFEFGFVPLTSNRIPHFISNTTSTRRNITSFRNNSTSSALQFRPFYADLPKNDVGSSQSEVLTTHAEFNKSLDCGGRSDLNWCDLGRNYPSVDIQHLLSRCTNLMGKLFVEIPNNSNGLTDTGENQQPGDFFTANGERKNTNPWSWSSYGSKREGRLCDGQKTFAKPSLARDTKGKWYLVVQTTNYVQRVPMEVCSNIGQPCANISSCGVKSRCVQKYSYHLLISVDPQNFADCPFMRLFKFPNICTCHVINSSK